MKRKLKLSMAVLGLGLMACQTPVEKEQSLKDAFDGKFLIGTALNTTQVAGEEPEAIEITLKHFNSVVAENCMKMENLQPTEGAFFWDEADAFIELAEANNMHIVGHTLVWHSQAPDWLFLDEEGNDYSVSTPAKRDGIYNMLKELIDQGVKVDAVGLQGHLNIDSPSVDDLEAAIQKLASLGIQTMITELDITVLPWPSEQLTAEVSLNYELEEQYNPYTQGLSESANKALADRYANLFEMFLRMAQKQN